MVQPYHLSNRSNKWSKKLVLLLSIAIVALIVGLVIYSLNQTASPTPSVTNDQPPPSSATPTPTPSSIPPTSLACVQALPDAIKVNQKLMFAGYTSLLGSEHDSLSPINIGGLIMMDQASAAEVTAFRRDFDIPPLIGVDQEGGPVQRYLASGRLPSAADMSTHYSADQAYQTYFKDAQYLKSIGLTTNFAPVVDVISRQPNPLPDRLYSSNPAVVIRYATSFIKASQAAGVTPVIKHFPGLGSATGNTDYGPAATDPLSVLQTRDILPYQQLAYLKPDVMVSNASVPQLTDGQPAIWSAAAISLLRSYGYEDSVIYTDSLTAQAIPGYLSEGAIKAWQADVDIAMIVQTRALTPSLSGMNSTIVANATQALDDGRLNRDQFNKSVLRILNRKGTNPCTLQKL